MGLTLQLKMNLVWTMLEDPMNIQVQLNVSMERTLTCLGPTISPKNVRSGVTFCNHATSHMRLVALNIWNICLTKVNESLHLGMVFQLVEDGIGNLVKWLKDWHETMFEDKNACNKRCHE